jgi:hypothetical protein
MTVDQARPTPIPRTPLMVFGGLALLGVVVFVVALGVDADRAYRVFLHNWLLWASAAQGALVLSAAFRLTNARWQGPVHRLVDSFGAFVPVALLLFAVIFLGRHHLFHWIHDPAEVAGKAWWYNEGALFARDLFALLWITAISLFYLYLSLRPTFANARETATGWQRGLYERWTAGWRGDEREIEIAERRSRKLAAVLVLSYAACYSVLGIDMIMSLAPHWISTMFPAYYAWGGFLSAVSLTALVAVLLRNGEQLRGAVTVERRHDMGKMIFAFSIFWMYLFWSQYLVIWYGNIPEETSFIVARLGSEFLQDTGDFVGWWGRISEPYAQITLTAWILLWVLPFWVLLGQRPKKTPAILGCIAAGSVFAVLAGALPTPLGWVEVGVGLGFLGLFFLCFLAFSRVFPGVLPPRD